MKYDINRNTLSEELRELGYETKYRNNRQVNCNKFNKIESEGEAYFLGLLFADGNISSNKNYRVSLELEDKDSIEAFHSFMNNKRQIETKIRIREEFQKKEQITFRTWFCDKDVYFNLINLGCIPQKSTKIIECPDKNIIRDDLFTHFVRGYMDGDGSALFYPNKKAYYFALYGQEKFLKQLCMRIDLDENRIVPSNSIFCYKDSRKENVIEILNKLYENCNYKMERKYKSYLTMKSIEN